MNAGLDIARDETEARLIPLRQRAEYEAAGWTVDDIACHHSAYSLLATRAITKSEEP